MATHATLRPWSDLAAWHNRSFGEHPDERTWLAILFGGDRLTAVQDGGGAFVEKGGEVLAVASWSLTGEYGTPQIVGLWTAPTHRRQGHGHTALLAAVRHLLSLGAERIRIDCLGAASSALVRGLSPEILAHIEASYHSFPSLP